MDDLISRQAAIKAIPKRKEGLGGESWMMTYRRSGYNDCIDACLDAIRQLPSAQTERKKGFWEWGEDEDYRCSVCQKYVYGCLGEVSSGQYKYCPYCGCAMEGEEDDEWIFLYR